MPELSSTRMSHDSAMLGMRHSTSHMRGAGEHQDRLRPAMIEYPRTGPGQCESGKQSSALARSIDMRSDDRAVHAEQHDRGGTQQIGKAPPRHGIDRGVLHPGEQQQQSEDRFHIDRHQEQCVDVKIHRAQPASTRTPKSKAGNPVVPAYLPRPETMGEWTIATHRHARLWFQWLFGNMRQFRAMPCFRSIGHLGSARSGM